LLFLARKFQLAWNNAATTTITRARLLIKVAPDDLPPQLERWNNGIMELWNDGFQEFGIQSAYFCIDFLVLMQF
jgi:hypothetical protein